MRVHDLTKFDFERLLPNQMYLTYQAFFTHYFEFWGAQNAPWAKLSTAELQYRKQMAIEAIKRVEQEFKQSGFVLEDQPITLLVGQGYANGHAFYNGKTFEAWIGLECYETKRAVDIFVMHEITHAVHYSLSPEFYFASEEQHHCVWRQFITEGIASYVTKRLLNITSLDTLWADFIPHSNAENWMVDCEFHLRELCQLVLKNFDNSIPNAGLFYALEPKSHYEYRQGYYAALVLTEALCKRRNFQIRDILSLGANELKTAYRALLQQVAR